MARPIADTPLLEGKEAINFNSQFELGTRKQKPLTESEKKERLRMVALYKKISNFSA